MSEQQSAVSNQPPVDDYPGYHWEWVPDEGWQIGGDDRKCRMLRCMNAAAAGFWRRSVKGPQLWRYCADHMYGRKIENGVVVHRILVKDEESA